MNPQKDLNTRPRAMLAAALIGTFLLAGCDRAREASVQPTDSPATPVAERAADGAVAVAACTQDCGEGVSASIQCAAGETAECSCGEPPQARCVPPAGH